MTNKRSWLVSTCILAYGLAGAALLFYAERNLRYGVFIFCAAQTVTNVALILVLGHVWPEKIKLCKDNDNQ